MTRTEQKKELIEVLQDAPVKMAERFKRDFERIAFDSDADFNDWIDDVCLAIDHEEDKGKSAKRKALEAWVNDNKQQEQPNSVIFGLEDIKYYQQRIKGLPKNR